MYVFYLELYLNSLVQNITVNQYQDALISGLNVPISKSNFNTKCLYLSDKQEIRISSDIQIEHVVVNDLSGRVIAILLVNDNNVIFDTSIR
jgi:hypothetical protein